MRSRIPIILAASGALVLSALPAAGVVSTAEDGIGEVAEQRVTTTMQVSINPGRRGLVDISNPVQAVETYDRAGTLVDRRTSAVTQDETPAELTRFKCFPRGTTEGFRAHPPFFINNDYGMWGSTHYISRLYSVSNARRVNGRWMLQIEGCSAGVTKMHEAIRLIRGGTGIAYAKARPKRRIAQAWQTGPAPSDLTASLAFRTNRERPRIFGKVEQNGVGHMEGGFTGPYNTGLNKFRRNAVNAWWEADCLVEAVACTPLEGSSRHQGAVVHGLWEFVMPTRDTRYPFRLTTYEQSVCVDDQDFPTPLPDDTTC